MLHYAADLAIGVPIEESGAVQFFTVHAIAIMFEDGVQAVMVRLFGKHYSCSRRFTGYVWVMLFMIWTTPTWAYPAARVVRHGQDVLLPFSLIKYVLSVLLEESK